MNNEMFIAYVLPVLAAFITGMAGYIGTQFKKLYEKYVNTKVKKDVANTCVKAVEQLYHDLGGPEKLRKAQEGIRDMLDEKGIPISDLELNLLIESVVAEFNYGFAKASEVATNED
jgi:ribosomal protein L20A (L18A)